jgi:serine/threonine protein kinase
VVLGVAGYEKSQKQQQEEEIMQLELLEKLAEENLAEVFLARLTLGGTARLITARRLHSRVTEVPGVVDALIDASAAMKSVEHGNILRHMGFGEAGGGHYWITERTDGFDLAMAINRLGSHDVHINSVRSLQIGLDFLHGLQALHQQDLLHGGLTPRYVLLGYDGVVRLDGIGFESTLLGIGDLQKQSRRLRSDYLAPEVVQGRNPVPQSDIFSSAAIMYTLLTGSPPLDKESSGAGMPERHSPIELPSKRDRTLPFSCDAIFIKALSATPRQRHDSIDSFTAAIKRLRAAMQKGPDEGRAGVKNFVENLYPNEAMVWGKPGSIDKPAMGAGIWLNMPPREARGATPSPAPVVPEPEIREPSVPESQAAEVREPATREKADEEGLARVAAWEMAFGTTGKPADKKQQPPPLPAQPPPVPAEKKEASGPTSVVVDWMGLGEEQEPEDTEEVRSEKEPTQEEPVTSEPLSAPPVSTVALAPEVEDPTPVPTNEIPSLVEPEEEEKTVEEISAPAGTIQMHQSAEPGTPTDVTVPGRKPPQKIMVILLAVVVVAVLVVAFWPKDCGEAQDDGAGTSLVAFLSVHTDQPARVTLDGELLEGGTPVRDKVLRVGEHRVVVDSLDGTRLMDEAIMLVAGEHKDIRVVIATAPGAVAPPTEVKTEKPTGKKVRKKKRVRRKRRRTRK